MDIRFAMNIIRKEVITQNEHLAEVTTKTSYMETQYDRYASFTVRGKKTMRETTVITSKTDDYHRTLVLEVIDTTDGKCRVVFKKDYEYTRYNDNFHNIVNQMKKDLKLS